MKNILIITQSFAPRNAVASIRFTKVAKYLARTGEYHIHVITEGAPLGEPQDEILKKDIESVKDKVTIYTIDNQRLGKKIGLTKGSSSVGAAARFWTPGEKVSIKARIKGQYFFHYQKVFTNKAFKIANQLISNNQIDALITTYGGIGATAAGLKIKKKHPTLNWINDYRDPIRAKTPALVKKSYKIATEADAICNSITGASSSYWGTNTHPEKFHVITNSCDPEDIKNIKDISSSSEKRLHSNDTFNNKFQICFTGTFYPGKFEADTLCKIISELVSEGVMSKDKISLTLAGKSTHEITKTAEKYNLSDIVEENGFIPRCESLSIQKDSDLLCFFLWNEANSKDIIAGKVMEYTMMDKPIACFIRGEIGQSLMKKTIRSNELGECFEEAEGFDDYNRMKDFISNLYYQKISQGKILQKNSAKIKYIFSAEYMTQKFKELL